MNLHVADGRRTDGTSAAHLTKQEAADLLGVHLATVDRLIKRGQLPAYRVAGRSVRLLPEDVQSLREERERLIPISAPGGDAA